VKRPKAELERFIEEHGGVVICGHTPRGPIYTLGDGTKVAVPLDGDEFFFALPGSVRRL
jgi:hypothetical protein